MPTPSEQKALAFVAIVILLGGAARVLRAGAIAPAPPSAAEQQALARQAFAASSSAASQRSAKAAKGRRSRSVSPKRRDDGVNIVGGVASVPFSDARPGLTDPRQSAGINGAPPPWPRIDTDFRGQPSGQSTQSTASRASGGRASRGSPPAGPIDLDTASESDIESLPRVGPALARRIVANRDSLGPFSTLAALRRVKGIGPATLEKLAPLVTFSGQARR